MENINEIINDANWCLGCINKPCSKDGCPMSTKIPEFIAEIKNNNYKEAYDILIKNNILSHICSLVCPQEEQCEGKCIRGIKQEPTHIGKLERFVNEWALEKDYKYKFDKDESNGLKVALIGSGPSSLICAVELLVKGFKVDIYEREKVAGGILTYGIPDFRLDKDLVEDVIKQIEDLGAEFFFEKELGKDILLSDLKKEYDAVFIGIGAEKSTTYSLSEEDIEKVYKSDDFLKAYNEDNYLNKLGVVAVIGGGNVAMDSARAAMHMDSKKVKILYRRDRAHMPAREVELEEALADGVEFKELVRVISANVKNGKIESLNCIKTKIVDGKAVDDEGTEYIEEADSVVFAIGLKPNKELLEKEGILLDDWGMLKVDEDGKTNLDNVYAGGDVTESKSTVCRAAFAGKRAAEGIIKNLLGE